MFTDLAPQKIQHHTGYIVQTGGRYSLQYVDGDIFAEIEVDFGPITGLYPDSMTVRRGDSAPALPSSDERELIVARVEEALNYWGMKFKIYKGRS